jgi:hypothetical protein
MVFENINCWDGIGSGNHSKANLITLVLVALSFWLNKKRSF